MKCAYIEEVRENIDRCDDDIIRLIAERAGYVKQAAQFKKSTDAVKAPERVEAVIHRVRAKANEYGLDEAIAEAVYKAMISGFIGMELKEYGESNGR